MNLLGEVLLLPLAPVRGVGWIAKILLDEADREMAAQSPARKLEDLAAATANGEIDPETAQALEAEIIDQMLRAHDSADGA
jgi:hypothetical protein